MYLAVTALIAMLEAVVVIRVAVSCLSESVDFYYGPVSISISVTTIESLHIKPDIERILCLVVPNQSFRTGPPFLQCRKLTQARNACAAE